MYTCNMWLALWFCFAIGAAPGGNENGVSAPKDALFSKKLSDGSVLFVEMESHRETILPPRERPKDLPKDAVLETVDLVIDHYRLVKLTAKEREVLWETESQSQAGVYDGVGPRFTFWDAELVGEKVYVLYSKNHYAHLDVVLRQTPGRWATIKSEVMKDRERYLGVGRFIRDSEGLGFRFAVKPGQGYGVRWDIIDDTPRKRPLGP